MLGLPRQKVNCGVIGFARIPCIRHIELSVFGFLAVRHWLAGLSIGSWVSAIRLAVIFVGRKVLSFQILWYLRHRCIFRLACYQYGQQRCAPGCPIVYEYDISWRLWNCVFFSGRYHFGLKGAASGDRVERVYPGVHSDVGGGLWAAEQKVVHFDLAKIICNDMLMRLACWHAF